MTAAVLKAENLRVGYGGKPVLLDVSIELRPREVLCVIGHNGAGKSTLLRTLFGLAKPEAGRVLVDGQLLPRHLPRALAAHGVAMVPEGSGVFPGLTVAEIFALGMWSAGVAEAERAERVDMGVGGAAADPRLLSSARRSPFWGPTADGVDRARPPGPAALSAHG